MATEKMKFTAMNIGHFEWLLEKIRFHWQTKTSNMLGNNLIHHNEVLT